LGLVLPEKRPNGLEEGFGGRFAAEEKMVVAVQADEFRVRDAGCQFPARRDRNSPIAQ
jgi:hypothetical protein